MSNELTLIVIALSVLLVILFPKYRSIIQQFFIYLKTKLVTSKMLYAIGAVLALISAIVAIKSPIMVVSGKVLDEKGNPIENVMVRAQFAIAKDGSSDITNKHGYYMVYVWDTSWAPGKSLPSITVSKEGFEESWNYYDQWPWGPRYFVTDVVLQKKKEN